MSHRLDGWEIPGRVSTEDGRPGSGAVWLTDLDLGGAVDLGVGAPFTVHRGQGVISGIGAAPGVTVISGRGCWLRSQCRLRCGSWPHCGGWGCCFRLLLEPGLTLLFRGFLQLLLFLFGFCFSRSRRSEAAAAAAFFAAASRTFFSLPSRVSRASASSFSALVIKESNVLRSES